MSMLNQPVMQFMDDDGLPMAFAEAYFYETGTTTPLDVYTTSARDTAHSVPVVADDQGLFPAIYLDPEALARMKLIAAGGDLDNPLLDIDPVNSLFTVTAANIEDGAIEEKLGYTPVDPDNAVFTANVRLNFTPTELNADDAGYLGVPVNTKNVDYTLTVADSGKMVVKDDTSTPTWTIPAATFPIGHWIEVSVRNTGEVSLVRDTGVALYGVNSDVDENKTLPEYFHGRITQVASDTWLLDPDPSPDVDLTANGYVIHANGFIEQWGYHSSAMADAATQAIVFGLEFPTACLGVTGQALKSAAGDGVVSPTAAPTTTGVTFRADGGGIDGFYWNAWGH